MAGTLAGGRKAAKTNKERYGEDHYRIAGAIGGKAKRPTKGFGYKRPCYCELIEGYHFLQQCSGKKGGRR